MQQIFATILHVFLTFLEASFRRNEAEALPGKTTTKEEDDDDSNIYNHQKDQEAKKKATEDAYKFLELEPPCELEQVRKKYKQLSLRHHPDRNGGSQQSHETMQKLNACFKLIEEHILGDIVEAKEEQEEEEPQFNYKEFMKQQREAKEQMEREIRQEQERYQQMKQEFDQNKQKDKTHCHQQQRAMDLQSEQGRQQAQTEFQERVKKQKQQKEKEKREQKKEKEQKEKQEKKSASTPAPPDKPKNPVMDYNLNDLVVALRLKMPDIALKLMEENINKHVQSRALDAQFTGERMTLKQLGMEYLLKPLDLDQNMLLHYAVYYEIYQVVNAVCGIAHNKFNSLEAVLLAKNQYGQTPWTFAEIAQDESIRNLVQSQMDLVQQIRNQTRLFPAIRSGCMRLFQILTHLDLVATLSLGLSFLLGYKIFQIHYSLAIFMALVVQYFRVISIAEKCMYNPQLERQQVQLKQNNVDVSLLISCYSIWIATCQLVVWIYPFVMIELLALLLPLWVAILMSRSRRRQQSGIFAVPWMIFSLSRVLERVLQPVHSIVSKLSVLVRYHLVKPVLLVVAGGMIYGVHTLVLPVLNI